MDTMELIVGYTRPITSLLTYSPQDMYAPQIFVQRFHDELHNVNEEDIDLVLQGPTLGAWYWGAWGNIKNNGYVTRDGANWNIFHCEGEIWLVHPEHNEGRAPLCQS